MLFFAVRRGTPLGPHFFFLCLFHSFKLLFQFCFRLFSFHSMQNSIEFQTELLSKKCVCVCVCVFFVFPSYPTPIQTSSCFSEASTLQRMEQNQVLSSTRSTCFTLFIKDLVSWLQKLLDELKQYWNESQSELNRVSPLHKQLLLQWQANCVFLC